MKVMVTGGAGFIGTHLVNELINRYFDVVVVDDLSTGVESNIPSKSSFYLMDILDPRFPEIVNKEHPQVLIHLAAQTSVQYSLQHPEKDLRVNGLGSLKVFKTCATNGVAKVIFFSTAAVYGNPETLPITETHVLNPESAYGISKYTAEQYLSYFHQLSGMAYTVFRPANVFGEGQDQKGEGGVVSIFLNRFRQNENIEIFGDGEQTRDFIYVKDVVEACILAITKGDNEVFNISTAKCTTINNLFKNIKNLTNSSLDAVYSPSRQGDIRFSVLDNTKALKILGFSAQHSLKQGLINMISTNKLSF